MPPAPRVLRNGDAVYDTETSEYFIVDSSEADQDGRVPAYPFADTGLIKGRPPSHLDPNNLLYMNGSGYLVPCILTHRVQEACREVRAAQWLVNMRASRISTTAPSSTTGPLLPPRDAAYNMRKADLNSAMCDLIADHICPLSTARVLALDDFPRDLDQVGETSDRLPATTAMLLRRGVLPGNIFVVNRDSECVVQAVRGAGAYGDLVSFNDYVTRGRLPGQPFDGLYLDACGFYRGQLREGLQAMFHLRDIWLNSRVLIIATFSKRDPNDPIETFKTDCKQWCEGWGAFRLLEPEELPTDKSAPVWCVGGILYKKLGR